jgi:hypothetical protein
MARHVRANIRLSDYDLTILGEAAKLWPSDADNRSELIRRVLWHWYVARERDGGKTARINEHTDKAVSQAKDEIIAEVRKVKGSNHV